jgi:hypothetical protein
MKTALISLSVLIGSFAVAASIVFTGRWEISAVPGDAFTVYRLDWWNGAIDHCAADTGGYTSASDISSFFERSGNTVHIICRHAKLAT